MSGQIAVGDTCTYDECFGWDGRHSSEWESSSLQLDRGPSNE